MLADHLELLEQLVRNQADATLEELRSRLPVAVSVPTLSRTLLELKLSFPKKFCLRPSKTGRMSHCGDRLGRPR